MPITVVVGASWGDEGKGKIVDILAEQSNIVVRCQGGNNAGHTIKQANKTFALRLIPSGILFENVHCYIAAGTVLNPKTLFLEIENLQKEGVSVNLLKIDPRVHIIMPWHITLDAADENLKKENSIGTTKNGIGPCYEDKFRRIGIRLQDLIYPEIFKEKANFVAKLKNDILTKIYSLNPLNTKEIIDEYIYYGQKLKPFVEDISKKIYEAYIDNKNILFEGAQGTMLDIDYGTYPFVTSCNPISGGACASSGISPTYITNIIGVCKAYTTRVGSGPFPTETEDDIANLIRNKGNEFGTNTKRKRRIGWFDAVAINHSKRINGFNRIALNKLDILSNIETLKICKAYKLKNNKTITDFPCDLNILDGAAPIYEELPGFYENITNCKTVEDLPINCKKYILKIEELTGCKVKMIGVGPKRNQNIYRDI